EQVVRGRDHHAEIGAHGLGQHRDRRRRHRADQQHIHTDRGKPRNHGIFDHVAGQTGVLADDDAMAMLAALEQQARGLAHLERELGRDQPVRTAPNSIGTEIIAAHVTPSGYPPQSRDATTRLAPLPGTSRGYKTFGAKMASKNMMNHYPGTSAWNPD